jgi:hypothetical protein
MNAERPAYHTREEFLELALGGEEVFLEIRVRNQRALSRIHGMTGRLVHHDLWKEDGEKLVSLHWFAKNFYRYTWARRTVEDWLLAEIAGRYAR